MNEIKTNKTLSWAGFFFLIGCTLMIVFSQTILPKEWVNFGLVFAILLGILAAGLSAASVSQKVNS
ncbi:MAG: hypothetical protein ACKO9H_03210 [Planctomycetota bacterium]|jgi:cadmium resistance protein CadD (predicted permease)